MILPYSRVKINGDIVWAENINVEDKEKIKVNGTEFFERIELTKKNLESLNLPFEKTKSVWQNKIPYLHSGKYKVTYNQTDYYMTYLDELDLFRRVVCQTCY